MAFWTKKTVVKPSVSTAVEATVKQAPAPIPFASQETTSSVSPYSSDSARVMITNGGPHPAELWAQVSAEHIAPVSNTLIGHRRAAALELQSKIAKVFEKHYQDIQEIEKQKLRESQAHVLTDLSHAPHIEQMIADIQAVAIGTEWEKHFTHDGVLALLDQELGTHIRTVKHIERSWHIDRNPDHPHAEFWKANK